MFECPNCNTQIPRWKALTMTNFTKIQCENCGANLKPDTAVLSKVASTGVLILLPIAMIGFRTFGVFGLVFVFIIGFFVASVATVRLTTFEVIEDEIITE